MRMSAQERRRRRHYNITEMARILNVEPEAFRHLVRTKQVLQPTKKIGKTMYYNSHVAAHNMNLSSAVRELREKSGTPHPVIELPTNKRKEAKPAYRQEIKSLIIEELLAKATGRTHFFNKLIKEETGVMSRRKIEDWICASEIKVPGMTRTELANAIRKCITSKRKAPAD